MIITKDAIIAENQPFFNSYIPKFEEDQASDLQDRIRNRIIITPASGMGSYVQVRFVSSLVWTVSGRGAIPLVGTILFGLLDTPLSEAIGMAATGGSLRGLVANGKTIPDAVEDVADAITQKQQDSPVVKYIVVGEASTDPFTVYDVGYRLNAATFTSDTDRTEEASIDKARLSFGDFSDFQIYGNIGKNDLDTIDDEFKLPSDLPAAGGALIAELSLQGVLKTAGGVVGSTTSLIRVRDVLITIREKRLAVIPTVAAPMSFVIPAVPLPKPGASLIPAPATGAIPGTTVGPMPPTETPVTEIPLPPVEVPIPEIPTPPAGPIVPPDSPG